MARYDGMEEIIQRLQSRLEPEEQALERVRSQPLAMRQLLLDDRSDESAIECIARMQREVEQLGRLFQAGNSGAIAPREQERVLTQLRTLLQELWRAEHILQTDAPHE